MTTTAVTFNGAIPNQPQAINADIEINSSSVLVDLAMQLAQGKIAGVQTIYVDLINHAGDVSIYMPDTGQRITAKSHTQGYYPVLSTNLMKFEISSSVNGKFPIQFINFPIALGVWGHNVIKGDKGDKGDAGADGGLIVTENSAVPANGKEIALIENDVIKLKRLVAGDNITLTETADAITINSTGGAAPIFRALYANGPITSIESSPRALIDPTYSGNSGVYTVVENSDPDIYDSRTTSYRPPELVLQPGIYEFTMILYDTDVYADRGSWVLGLIYMGNLQPLMATDAYGNVNLNGALTGSFIFRVTDETGVTPYIQHPGTGSGHIGSLQMMVRRVGDL